MSDNDLFHGHTFYEPAPYLELPEDETEDETEDDGDDEEEELK